MDNPILFTIAACEIGFWVLALGGTAVRYVLRLRRTSTVMLSLLPVLDIALIIAVALDLARGGEVSFAHQLAGIYLGWTVMFAHSTVSWLDVRFAHKFAGGPPPERVEKGSAAAYRREVRAFVKWLGAAAIALVVTFGLAYTVADADQARELKNVVQPVGIITVGWLLFGPLWVRSTVRSTRASTG